MNDSFWPFLIDRLPQLWEKTGEHVLLTGAAVVGAILMESLWGSPHPDMAGFEM